MKSRFLRGVVLGMFVFVAPFALAKGKGTLIEMDGDKPVPGLAKEWKKVGEGQYEFTLDTSAEISKGEKLTPALAVTSIEKKLGDKGVKAVPKGDNAVTVTYTGGEPEFLKNVAKTKIRSGKEVDIALESSTSAGGIRANTASREPAEGEVKTRVLTALPNNVIEVIVVKSSGKGEAAKVVDGKKVKITTKPAPKVKPGDTLFFRPTALKGEVWETSQVTLK